MYKEINIFSYVSNVISKTVFYSEGSIVSNYMLKSLYIAWSKSLKSFHMITSFLLSIIIMSLVWLLVPSYILLKCVKLVSNPLILRINSMLACAGSIMLVTTFFFIVVGSNLLPVRSELSLSCEDLTSFSCTFSAAYIIIFFFVLAIVIPE